MHWQHYLERFVCTALGVGMGVLIALTMDWSIWIWPPLCAALSGLSCRPLELIRDVRTALKKIDIPAHRLCLGTALVLGYFALHVIAISIVPFMGLFSAALIWSPGLPPPENDWKLLVGSIVLGLIGTGLGFGASNDLRKENIEMGPLLKRLPYLPDDLERMEFMHWRLLSPLIHPLSHLYFISTSFAFIIDAIFLTALAAGTRLRISVMCGGLLGGTIAVAAKYYGYNDIGIVLIGAFAGGLAGAIWYPIARWIAGPVASEEVIVT